MVHTCCQFVYTCQNECFVNVFIIIGIKFHEFCESMNYVVIGWVNVKVYVSFKQIMALKININNLDP